MVLRVNGVVGPPDFRRVVSLSACAGICDPNFIGYLQTDFDIELAVEALDPSFMCNVVVEDLSGPLRDLLSFLSRDGVCTWLLGS